MSRICFALVFDKLYYIYILWSKITWRSGIQNSTRGVCCNLIFQFRKKLNKFYGVIAIDWCCSPMKWMFLCVKLWQQWYLKRASLTFFLNLLFMIRVTSVYLSFIRKSSIKLCLYGHLHVQLFLENAFLKR